MVADTSMQASLYMYSQHVRSSDSRFTSRAVWTSRVVFAHCALRGSLPSERAPVKMASCILLSIAKL
jgi:hypothetical protein